MHSRISADPRFRRDGGDAQHEIWSAESIQAIATFHTAANPVGPAAICQQVVDRDGTMQIERQVRCEADKPACDRLLAAADAEDGSGDAP